MRHRRIGDTDLVLSEAGFGTGGNAGLMVGGSELEQDRAVARAIDRGITYFDTAPDYGDGRAEINLGRALARLGARPIVTTKVEIRAENLSDIAGHVVHSVEESLRRLRRDAVDVLQIHNGPTADRPVLEGRQYKVLWLEDYIRPGGVLDGLERVISAGKARYAGFICRGNDHDAAVQLLDTGLFRLLNLPYTLLNPTPGIPPSGVPAAQPDYGGILDLARERGARAAIFSPLAGGLLTGAVLAGQGTHPLARRKDFAAPGIQPAIERAALFAALAERHGMTLVELAYRFILSHAGAASIVGGFSSSTQVDDIIEAVDRGPLAPELLDAVAHIWRNGAWTGAGAELRATHVA